MAHPLDRYALALLLLGAACKKPSPARFCDQDLSGVWLNASDRHFAYRFRDHGGVLRGEFLERSEDGGLKNPDEPITFELHRTDAALAGVMRSTDKLSGGRTCPVEFGIQVKSCQTGAIQAIVETSVPIGEDCKRKSAQDGGEVAPALAEFRFERELNHRSDGGEAPIDR
ncbi:MAG TPA: hypothetical protein VF993_07500 [Myxococcales bacterium]